MAAPRAPLLELGAAMIVRQSRRFKLDQRSIALHMRSASGAESLAAAQPLARLMLELMTPTFSFNIAGPSFFWPGLIAAGAVIAAAKLKATTTLRHELLRAGEAQFAALRQLEACVASASLISAFCLSQPKQPGNEICGPCRMHPRNPSFRHCATHATSPGRCGGKGEKV